MNEQVNKDQLQIIKDAIAKLPVTVELNDVDAGYPPQWRLNPNIYWVPPLSMAASVVSNLTVAFSHFWRNRRDAVSAFPMTLLVGSIRNSTFRGHTFGTINVDNTNDFIKRRLYRTLYVNYVRYITIHVRIRTERLLLVPYRNILCSRCNYFPGYCTIFRTRTHRRSPATGSRTTAATTCSTCA